jgi:hypothetical protein
MESTTTATMSTATVLRARRSSHHRRQQRNCKQPLHTVNVRPTTPKSFESPTAINA